MSPVGSLMDLTEPAYVLLGSVLPQESDEYVELLVSPTSIVTFDASTRPIMEYFSVPRGRSEALADIRRWDGTAADLDGLVADNVLVLLPPEDQSRLVEALKGLTVRVTSPARRASDGQSVLLLLPDERAVALDLLTAAVLKTPPVRSLGAGVDAVSREARVEADVVWRLVLHDLSAVLRTGAGHLGLPEDPT